MHNMSAKVLSVNDVSYVTSSGSRRKLQQHQHDVQLPPQPLMFVFNGGNSISGFDFSE